MKFAIGIAEVLVFVAATALGACETTTCTRMGCGYALSLEVVAGTWSEGTYTARLTEADREHVCTFQVPPQSAGEGGQAGADQGNASEFVVCEQTAGEPFVQSLDAYFDRENERLTLDMFTSVREVRLVLERDGELLLDEQRTPKYSISSYPNGPDCGSCDHADETFELSDPNSE